MSDQPIFEKIVVGGGIAGLWSAYEILRIAQDTGKPLPKVVLLTDKIHAPTAAGSNLSRGIDGYEEGSHAHAPMVQQLVRDAMAQVGRIVAVEQIACRWNMGSQLLGDSQQAIDGVKVFLVNQFGYQPNELKDLEANDMLKFPGYARGIYTDAIGQINVPELQVGLIKAIARLGGQVIVGAAYQDQQFGDNGITHVLTANGATYETKSAPLLATGAHHMAHLGLPVSALYTAVIHIPLDVEDVKKILPNCNPMAFSDTKLDGDVFWGSLDNKGVLTIGFGETDNPHDADRLRQALLNKFGQMFPDFAETYAGKISYSFNAQTMTKNGFPLVGRLGAFDINTGWCTRGIVSSLAAATAYAKYFILGDDKDLKLFEALNVDAIRPNFKVAAEPANRRGDTLKNQSNQTRL
jgi:glycine/D-amino acid oxidase-like deaminating enzyme